jgi:hypothetical protein
MQTCLPWLWRLVACAVKAWYFSGDFAQRFGTERLILLLNLLRGAIMDTWRLFVSHMAYPLMSSQIHMVLTGHAESNVDFRTLISPLGTTLQLITALVAQACLRRRLGVSLLWEHQDVFFFFNFLFFKLF